jgi:GNAT superfamily N-acetyltransferase
MPTIYHWRGDFENVELDALHTDAFETPASMDEEKDWKRLVSRHSLGWVTARDGNTLVGFVNVIWDGMVHAWIQDVMVASSHRGSGLGTSLVTSAREACRRAGCEWLHVDFDASLGPFYLQTCGFSPTSAGIIHLS